MGEAPERYAEQTPLNRERLLEAVALPQVTLAYQFGNSPGAGFSAAFLGLSTTLTHCLQRGSDSVSDGSTVPSASLLVAVGAISSRRSVGRWTLPSSIG